MSDDTFHQSAEPAYPAPEKGAEPAVMPAHAPEAVARGLLAATLAVLAGVVLTVVIWRFGFIASITSFVMAAGAVFLYSRAAVTTPRKGLIPLVLLIVVGVVAAFFGVVASDAWDVYGQFDGVVGVSRSSFILDNIFRGEVLREYAQDMAMFGVFAVLGLFGTLRRLLSSAR
jgi:hypothetical protein